MATRRRKVKTTSKRRRGAKRATKRSAARARKRATKRRPKKRAKTRPTTRATAARKRRKVPARAKARARAATTPKRGPRETPPVEGRALAAAAAPEPVAAPPAPSDDLARAIEAQLRHHGFDPPDETVVAVLTALGAGYRQGPAHPPSWLHVDVNGPIAEGMVERYATGERAHDIDRSTHRPQVRAAVG